MKKLLGIAALFIAFGLSAAAQIQRMTADDQDKFDSYYARWVQDKQSNNRDDMLSMEHRMQDLMDKYQIPTSTPYDQVASSNAAAPPSGYDRGYVRDRDRGAYAGSWQGRMSQDDQKQFNKEYQKWQDASAKHDQDDIDKHARKMQEIMARNSIPADTPFDAVASATGYPPRINYREYQNKFSPDDQQKFDKAYEKWLRDRQKNDRDDIAKDEGKMQELMAKYNIPRDVPYNMLASSAHGYY
jgi:hypothetical protein